MENTITIRDDVDTAIQREIDPVELARAIYPRIEQALELALTPEEANEIRAQLETVTIYIKRSLPKQLRDRRVQFQLTHEGDMLYLQASSKAGALWGPFENRRQQGMNKSSGNYPKTVSAIDVGFKDHRDATACERIGELHDEDLRTYEEDTFQKMMKNGTKND